MEENNETADTCRHKHNCAVRRRALAQQHGKHETVVAVRDKVSATDRVLVSVLVTSVNPNTQELAAQLGFRLAGNIVRDEVAPNANLKLLTNNAGGQQEFDFAEGKRMNRIEAIFPLNGDINKYPFHSYETTLWLLMMGPAGAGHRSQAKAPGGNRTNRQFTGMGCLPGRWLLRGSKDQVKQG